jgi:hypothetical protein
LAVITATKPGMTTFRWETLSFKPPSRPKGLKCLKEGTTDY